MKGWARLTESHSDHRYSTIDLTKQPPPLQSLDILANYLHIHHHPKIVSVTLPMETGSVKALIAYSNCVKAHKILKHIQTVIILAIKPNVIAVTCTTKMKSDG